MATLVGPDDHSLEITVLRYEFDLAWLRANATNTTADPDEWDANWLVVRVAGQAGALRWSVTRALFLTWDISRLIGWLDARLDDSASEQPDFSVMDPHFQIETCGPADPSDIRVSFGYEFLPRNISRRIEMSITLSPGMDGIRRFASELRDELQRFPIIAIETNGTALRWLNTFGDPAQPS